MSIYELTANEIRLVAQTTFRDVQIQERTNLQPLLRDQIDVIAQGCLVIAEEFGDWEESRRRIDLLAIDQDANLVVIELKRTEDGGHMELQAVRYASMVSAMTFEQAVHAYAKFLNSMGREEDATSNILEHLGWPEPDEEAFAQDVRVVLASANFSRELTSSVMWLNERGIDIRCVRLNPHKDGERVLLDVQQVIPLPEVEDYQVRVREKSRRERESRISGRSTLKYMLSLGEKEYGPFSKRETIFRVVKYLCGNGVSPEEIMNAVSVRKNVFRSAPGEFDTVAAFIDAASKVVAEKGRRFDHTRWYIGNEDRMEHNGRTYALSNGWGAEAMGWLGEVLAAFPDQAIDVQAVGS